MPRSNRIIIERFNNGWTENSDGCWIWNKYKNSKGYGYFKCNGKTCASHRVSWELNFGEIPDGLHVLHICDTPSCVNPLHLRIGTNQDNVDDKMMKGRYSNMNTAKKACSKCGGEFEVRICKGKTYRICAPCRRKKEKEFRVNNFDILKQRREARKHRCKTTVL